MNDLYWLFSQLKKGEVESFHSRSKVSMGLCMCACVCVYTHAHVSLEKVIWQIKAWSSKWVIPTDFLWFWLHENMVSPCLLSSPATIFWKTYWSGKHLCWPTNKVLQTFPTCILTANSSGILESKVNILSYLKAQIPRLCMALKCASLALAVRKVLCLQFVLVFQV